MTAGTPSMRISPASGRCMPASRLTSVDLPAPFSPSKTWISPAWNSSDTRSSATMPGKRFVTWRKAATALAAPGGASADCPACVASLIIRVIARCPFGGVAAGYFGGAATEFMSARTRAASKIGSILSLPSMICWRTAATSFQTPSGMCLVCSSRTESSASRSGYA